MAVTIKDVAKYADVGVGTVSRVLNDSPLVSEGTRQRVLDAMEELDYTPNPFARRLPLGKSLTLAVVTPFFTRPSVVERLRGVEAAISDTEYDLIVFNVESVDKRDYYFREVCRPGRADGVIIISLAPTDDDAEFFLSSGSVVVLVDAHHPKLPRVEIDDIEGGRIATEHLLSLGHRRIGFLGDSYPNPFRFTSMRKRYVGYKEALEEAGVSVHPEYVVTGEHGRDVARGLAHQLLSLPTRPTAVFAASDTQALGVLEAARALDIRVPQDLSIVGYDDIEIAAHLELTTIRQPLFDTGWRGVQLLLQYMEDNGTRTDPVSELMPVELIVRGTTARAPS